jgi:arsenite-transporting ATPase
LLAYLALYGYAVDAVVVNKLLDDDVAAACGWLDAQCRYRAAIDEAFSPIPRLGAPLCNEEPAGADRLAELGHVIYDTSDPMDRFAPGAAIEILTHGAESLVRVPVGGVDRADIDLALDGDELLVTLGAHRRAVRLPDALSGHEVTGASVVDGHLEVVFQGSAP